MQGPPPDNDGYGGPGPPQPMTDSFDAPNYGAGHGNADPGPDYKGGGFDDPGFGGPNPPAGADPYGNMGAGPAPPPGSGYGGMQDPPAYGASPAASGDIGPFARAIFNKLVRGFSALTSLIALIVQFMLLGQGITSYMAPGNSKNPKSGGTTEAKKGTSPDKDEDEDEEEEGDKTSKSTKSSRSTSRTNSPSTTLLGRGLPTVSDVLIDVPPTPTYNLNLDKRMLHIRQTAAPRSVALNATHYVPNSDVPSRDGAVGFTASSHLFAAIVILLLFWLEWMLFMRKPTMFSFWGPLFIAVIQLYMALDVLGRALSPAGQAGAYILLVLAIINMFFAGWTVLQAKKNSPSTPPPMQEMGAPPLGGGFDDPSYGQDAFEGDPNGQLAMADGHGGEGEGQFVNGDPDAPPGEGGEGAPGMEEDLDGRRSGDSSPTSSRRPRRKRGRSRRASAACCSRADDVESCYSQASPRPRRHSYNYGSDYPPPAQNYTIPPIQQARPADEYTVTTPISLYGPNEYRRRLEQQRRTRRRSLTQPAMQFDPNTGQYVEPAGRFSGRAVQPMPGVQAEEEEEIDVQAQVKAADPRLRQDGFANRTKVWKRLQGDFGMIV